MTDPEPEPLVPETVEPPVSTVTPKTIERAEKVLAYVEDAFKDIPEDKIPDRVPKLLEEMRDGIRTLNEKLERYGGIVPAPNLTRSERRVAAAAAAGIAGKQPSLLQRLDALFAE